MLKIKKGDIVEVIQGKDKGKKGKVMIIYAQTNKALVENINTVKKHKRQTRQDQKGGIVSVEMPISISKLMLVCKPCGKPVRVGFKVDEAGNKYRICKKCKEVI
jgi:large subunit ribosomal protein L24